MSEDFEALSGASRIRIDQAFDAALDSRPSIGEPSIKSSKATAVVNSEPAGGFVIDSEEPPGGFIPSIRNDIQPSEDDLIPLSLIPAALQLLDLPPDDDEVSQVFRNAAGGWGGGGGGGGPRTDGVSTPNDDEMGRTVTRKDWRAVCAVIMGEPQDEPQEDEDAAAGGFLIDEEQSALITGVEEENSLEAEEDRYGNDNYDDDDNDDEEAYQESSLSSLSSVHLSDSGSDEYMEPSPSKSKYKYKSKSGGRKSKRPSTSIPYGAPTSRQKRTSLDTFALFFPSSPPLSDADLSTKRLMFKDIVRVSAMLKEKIKAEEVEEMLSLFSTAPDKSMSFDDFTKMMITAKLAWGIFGNRNTLPAVCLPALQNMWRHMHPLS